MYFIQKTTRRKKLKTHLSLWIFLVSIGKCTIDTTEQRYNTLRIHFFYIQQRMYNIGRLFIDTKSFERRWQEHQYSSKEKARNIKMKIVFHINRWKSFLTYRRRVVGATKKKILSKFVHPSKHFLTLILPFTQYKYPFLRLSASIFVFLYIILWICRTHKNNIFFNQKI